MIDISQVMDLNSILVHYPTGESNPSGFTLVSGYGIFKQENEAKKKICAKFLKYITSEAEQEVLEEYGVFPVYMELLAKSSSDPLMKTHERDP